MALVITSRIGDPVHIYIDDNKSRESLENTDQTQDVITVTPIQVRQSLPAQGAEPSVRLAIDAQPQHKILRDRLAAQLTPPPPKPKGVQDKVKVYVVLGTAYAKGNDEIGTWVESGHTTRLLADARALYLNRQLFKLKLLHGDKRRYIGDHIRNMMDSKMRAYDHNMLYIGTRGNKYSVSEVVVNTKLGNP